MLVAAYPLLMTRRAIANARRARGLLLALVLGLSQATAWLHAAAISHATCLEHGESIHAQQSDAGAPAAAADVTGPTAGTADADRAAPDVSVDAAHDHCASSALVRWRDAVLAAPLATALPPAVHRSTFPAPSRDAAAGAVVYVVAPKTSPPHADA
jgi:hypothetical protein